MHRNGGYDEYKISQRQNLKNCQQIINELE